MTRRTTARAWGFLAGAVLVEVAASMALQAAVTAPVWYVVVVSGYLTAFVFLSIVLRNGMPVGVAYGTWAAAGTALTALLASILFGQLLTAATAVGIGLVIVGVLCIEFGGRRAPAQRVPD